MKWQEEVVYLLGDEYFDAVEEAINEAKRSVQFQSYIFSYDRIGQRFAALLCQAAKRNIEVRIIVDGIGSLGWIAHFGKEITESGGQTKVFHRLPWDAALSKIQIKSEKLSALQLLGYVNKRAHAKLIIIDGVVAFVGSRNISANHSETLNESKAWLDVSVKVAGNGVEDLSYAFDYLWLSRGEKGRFHIKSLLKKRRILSQNIRLNIFWRQRKRNYKELCKMIAQSKDKVWVMCSYFLPNVRLLRALRDASKKGVSIKIIVPAVSDVFFFPWVSCVFYNFLLKYNVEIYEYKKSILHAKVIVIDDLAIVGSSNLNQRSLLHDFEADVVILEPSSIKQISDAFQKAIQDSEQVTSECYVRFSLMQRLFGQFALLFKKFL